MISKKRSLFFLLAQSIETTQINREPLPPPLQWSGCCTRPHITPHQQWDTSCSPSPSWGHHFIHCTDQNNSSPTTITKPLQTSQSTNTQHTRMMSGEVTRPTATPRLTTQRHWLLLGTARQSFCRSQLPPKHDSSPTPVQFKCNHVNKPHTTQCTQLYNNMQARALAGLVLTFIIRLSQDFHVLHCTLQFAGSVNCNP